MTVHQGKESVVKRPIAPAIVVGVAVLGLLAASPVLARQSPSAPLPVPEADPDATAPLPEPPVQTESFYRLQVSDVVVVRYRYTPEYDATVTVRPDGFITLPIVGEVRIADLTIGDARRAIVAKASERLREPELTIELKDFQKPRFIVGGQVGSPGEFELRGHLTVLEAIAIAGGFKTSAKHSQVVLFRRYDNERAVTRIINAKELAKADGKAEDPELRAGDFLFVPQNRISKIERLVPFTTLAWMLRAFVP